MEFVVVAALKSNQATCGRISLPFREVVVRA
jgi:hypothetical protein